MIVVNKIAIIFTMSTSAMAKRSKSLKIHPPREKSSSQVGGEAGIAFKFVTWKGLPLLQILGRQSVSCPIQIKYMNIGLGLGLLGLFEDRNRSIIRKLDRAFEENRLQLLLLNMYIDMINNYNQPRESENQIYYCCT